MDEIRKSPAGSEDFKAPETEALESGDPIIYLEKLGPAFFEWCELLTDGAEAGIQRSINQFFDNEPFSVGDKEGMDDTTTLADCSPALKQKVVNEIASWQDRIAQEFPGMTIVATIATDDGKTPEIPFDPATLEVARLIDIQFFYKATEDEAGSESTVQEITPDPETKETEMIKREVLLGNGGKCKCPRCETVFYDGIKATVIYEKPKDRKGVAVILEEDDPTPNKTLTGRYEGFTTPGPEGYVLKEGATRDKAGKGDWNIKVPCWDCLEKQPNIRPPKIPIWGPEL